MSVVAIALGLLVGLSLGALGGGGSTLAVPTLVFVGGMTATDATTASLLVVGAASAVGVGGHLRKGNVRLGAGLAFGAAGVVGARVGTSLNRSLDENALLLAFSVLILFVASRMYRSARRRPDQTVEIVREPIPTAAAAGTNSGTAVAGAVGEPNSTLCNETTPDAPRAGDPSSTRRRTARLSLASAARLAAAATVVGALTGLFGVGGGFAVVPALTLLLGFGAKEAIGTSLVVIAVNASVALAMRWGGLDLDWTLVAPFLVTTTVGVLAGSAIAHRVAADRLVVGFSIMLATVAVATAVSTVLA